MKLLAFLILLFTTNLALSQVQIVAEQDQERNLTLFAFNKEQIPYLIRIEFLKLENLESFDGRVVFGVANPGKSTLVKLRSIYVNEQTGFQYNTKLFKGNYQLGAFANPPYLIPVEEGTILSMRPLVAQILQKGSNSASENYTGVVFYFDKPAAICAPRKGIVSEIKMDGIFTSSGPSTFDKENFVEIYHQDGTFSRLTGLSANSAKVAVGETVFPGQVLAQSSLQADQQLHHVKMIQSRWEMGEMDMVWVNFPVTIYASQQEVQTDTAASDLESSHPAEIVSKEMDKKELKKISFK